MKCVHNPLSHSFFITSAHLRIQTSGDAAHGYKKIQNASEDRGGGAALDWREALRIIPRAEAHIGQNEDADGPAPEPPLPAAPPPITPAPRGVRIGSPSGEDTSEG